MAGGKTVLAGPVPGAAQRDWGRLYRRPARHQQPDRALLPGPASPAARTPTVSGSAPAGLRPLIS